MNLTKSHRTVSILKLAVGLVTFLLITAIAAVGHRKRKAVPAASDTLEDFDGTQE